MGATNLQALRPLGNQAYKPTGLQVPRPPGHQATRLPGLQATRPTGVQASRPRGLQASAKDLRRLTARHPNVKANCFHVKFSWTQKWIYTPRFGIG